MKLALQSEENGVVRLSLEGKVSQRHVASGDDPFETVLGENALSRSVLVDMSEVEALDSSGVNWLLIAQRKIKQAEGRLVLHSLSPIASNVIRVLNLQTVLQLADDETAAQSILEEDSA